MKKWFYRVLLDLLKFYLAISYAGYVKNLVRESVSSWFTFFVITVDFDWFVWFYIAINGVYVFKWFVTTETMIESFFLAFRFFWYSLYVVEFCTVMSNMEATTNDSIGFVLIGIPCYLQFV